MDSMKGWPEGYAVRPATWDDVEVVAALVNAHSQALTGEPLTEAAELRSKWGQPGFDLARDTRLVLSPDGGPVGFAAVWDPAPHVQIFAEVRVHPDHAGRGSGPALYRWVEKRARESLPAAPAGERVVLMTEMVYEDEFTRSLVEEQGYRPVRYGFRMVIEMDEPPPEPVIPDGLTIRTFSHEKDTLPLVRAMVEAFRDHWGHVERPFEDEYQEWVHWMETDPNYDPSLWFLAVDGDEVAGAAICQFEKGDAPGMGWVAVLGVRRPWRRRGVGMALLRTGFGELYRRGRRKVGLFVDAQSLTGATRLYRRAGMREARRYVVYEKVLRDEETRANAEHKIR